MATILFTIGYELRTGADLIAALREAGVNYLADIGEKPFSRKPDFREKALKVLCESAGIEYGPWPQLGSTQEQWDELKATRDIARFHRVFRAYAVRNVAEPLDPLARVMVPAFLPEQAIMPQA